MVDGRKRSFIKIFLFGIVTVKFIVCLCWNIIRYLQVTNLHNAPQGEADMALTALAIKAGVINESS